MGHLPQLTRQGLSLRRQSLPTVCRPSFAPVRSPLGVRHDPGSYPSTLQSVAAPRCPPGCRPRDLPPGDSPRLPVPPPCRAPCPAGMAAAAPVGPVVAFVLPARMKETAPPAISMNFRQAASRESPVASCRKSIASPPAPLAKSLNSEPSVDTLKLGFRSSRNGDLQDTFGSPGSSSRRHRSGMESRVFASAKSISSRLPFARPGKHARSPHQKGASPSLGRAFATIRPLSRHQPSGCRRDCA